MPNSLKARLKKLNHKGQIDVAEYEELINKLEGHDQELYKQAIDDFKTWINNENHVAIDRVYHSLIVVRGFVWVDAFETFEKEQLKGDHKNEE